MYNVYVKKRRKQKKITRIFLSKKKNQEKARNFEKLQKSGKKNVC